MGRLLLYKRKKIIMKIICDTREQDPLQFMSHEILRQKLNEGDYTTKDLLDYELETGNKTVRIERKKSTSELATNLWKDFARFEKELLRLYDYERKVLLCEFPYSHILSFPKNSGIPEKMQKYIRINSSIMLSKLEYITNIYDIEIIYTNNKFEASKKAEEILNDFEKKIKR